MYPLALTMLPTTWQMGGMSPAATLVEAMDMADQDVAQTRGAVGGEPATTLGPAQPEENDFELTKVQAAISKTVAQSVLMSGAASSLLDTGNTGNVNDLKAKGRRDRVAVRWALREASRKQREAGWKCDDYGCILKYETADGLTGELVKQVIAALR